MVDVAADAGVAATSTNSSGVVACDINNDGYQDIYVGALGVIGDDLDFRSAIGSDEQAHELREAVTDRLFLNLQDGTFEDITETGLSGKGLTSGPRPPSHVPTWTLMGGSIFTSQIWETPTSAPSAPQAIRDTTTSSI